MNKNLEVKIMSHNNGFSVYVPCHPSQENRESYTNVFVDYKTLVAFIKKVYGKLNA